MSDGRVQEAERELQGSATKGFRVQELPRSTVIPA
jgi:hypothetical protein